MAQTPFYEVNQAIVLTGGEDLNLCMQCGLCSASVPGGKWMANFIRAR